MGWLHVLISAVATWLLARDHPLFAIAAGITGLVSLWSYGVMHNLAVEAAKHRRDYSGGFRDFTERDLASVPNWLTNINMASAFLGLLFLIGACLARWL